MRRQTYDYYTVRYGSVGHKWAFQWPGGNTVLIPCRGKAMADKVARILAGSLKRNDNQLDGLARANINAIVNPPVEE